MYLNVSNCMLLLTSQANHILGVLYLGGFGKIQISAQMKPVFLKLFPCGDVVSDDDTKLTFLYGIS